MVATGFSKTAGNGLIFKQHGCSTKRIISRRSPVFRCEAPHSNGVVSDNSSNGAEILRSANWERKSDIYILRSDGYSCNRETVKCRLVATYLHSHSHFQRVPMHCGQFCL